MKALRKKMKQQEGAMLLEALIAILIFSFGILAIVGLQGVMIRHTSDSKYRIDASYLANQVIGQMWVDKDNLAQYVTGGTKFNAWKANVAATLPAGSATVVLAGTQVTVRVTWQPPGVAAPGHNYVAIADVNLN